MALQHDKEGFLTGPRQDIDHAAYARHLDILREIRGDTHSMSSDLSAIRKSLAPSRPMAPPRVSNSPVFAQQQLAVVIQRAQAAARGADGRFTAASTAVGSNGSGTRPASPSFAPTQKAVAAGGLHQRKANGQFGSGGGGESSDPDENRKRRDDRDGSHALSTAAESLKRTAGEMISGTSQVDPAIAAAKEVGDIVSPALGLLKPLGGFFKRKPKDDSDSQSVPWYRRILGQLREINKKAGGSGSGGGIFGSLLGGLGGLLKSPLKLLGMIPGMGFLGKIVKGGGGLLGRGAGFLGKMGGGLLKRIPLIGALLSGGSALASIFGADDPNKSAAENRKDRFTGGGAGIGSLIGGVVGMLGGPLGSIAGAAIGDVVGKQVGEWLSTVNWQDVGKSISDTWTATADWFKGVWGKVTDLASGTFSSIKDWFAEKLGIVTGAVTGAVNAAKNATASVVNKGKDLYNAGAAKVSAVKEAAVVTGGRLIGALDPGYRHKENFDGIKGGDSLATNGRYTNDEADRIRELKSGGFNTSANLKGGMPADIRKKIEDQAVANGLNPKDMVAMAAMESGGNANAISSTGAVGVYQFTGKTATGVGITNRFDADQNIAGGMALAKLNQDYLIKHGLPVTPENLYMMHQLGPSAASEVIQGAQDGKRIDQLSQGAQFGVRNNYGAGSVTAADYLAKNTKALDDRYNLVAGGAVAPSAQVASTAALPTVPATLAPISVSASPVNYAPTAPDLMRFAPKDAPSLVKPIGSSGNNGQPSVRVDTPLTQNLSDRSIAAVATGGIGMTGTL